MAATATARRGGLTELRLGTAAPLRPPQHWHVSAEWYVAETETGGLSWATTIDVATNDVTLAISAMRREVATLAREGAPARNRHHVSRQSMCSDPTHLENLPDELVAPTPTSAPKAARR